MKKIILLMILALGAGASQQSQAQSNLVNITPGYEKTSLYTSSNPMPQLVQKIVAAVQTSTNNPGIQVTVDPYSTVIVGKKTTFTILNDDGTDDKGNRVVFEKTANYWESECRKCRARSNPSLSLFEHELKLLTGG